MATGMQTWSTTASSNANADTNINWAEGMAPSQVNDSARAMMASAAKWVSDNAGTIITSGTGAAFTIGTNQVESALTDGYTVAALLHTTPAANATLSVDGLAAKPINFNSGLAITDNQIIAGTLQRFTYSATFGAWILNGFNQGVPIGAISPYAGSSSPASWLLCNGVGYAQASYSALFAIIGTTYGSTGAGMFSVPDLGGRVPAGKEGAPGRLSTLGSTVLGAFGGQQNEVLTQSNMPVTGPAFTGSASWAQWNGTTGNFSQSGGGANDAFVRQADLSNVLISGTVAGGSATPVITVQPTLILNYIIYAGV